MAATVMTVEFGTIHHYSSLEKTFWSLFLQFFLMKVQKLTEHYVNYDILVWWVLPEYFQIYLFAVL